MVLTAGRLGLLSLALVLLSMQAGIVSQLPPEFLTLNATELHPGTQASATVRLGSEAWFSFTVASAQICVVSTQLETLGDSRLSVYEREAGLIATDDDQCVV